MNILGLLGDLKIIWKHWGPLQQHNPVTADWSGTDNIKSPSHLGKVPNNLIAEESELDKRFLCWQQPGKVSSCSRGLSGMWQGSISCRVEQQESLSCWPMGCSHSGAGLRQSSLVPAAWNSFPPLLGLQNLSCWRLFLHWSPVPQL